MQLHERSWQNISMRDTNCKLSATIKKRGASRCVSLQAREAVTNLCACIVTRDAHVKKLARGAGHRRRF